MPPRRDESRRVTPCTDRRPRPAWTALQRAAIHAACRSLLGWLRTLFAAAREPKF
jgi:hypothetical protein